jgi:predicted Zn-dependent protease
LLAVEYLYSAGYDPQALSSFLQKVILVERNKPGQWAKASLLADRVKKNRRQVNALLPPAPAYTLDTSDFQNVKERLSNLQDRQQLEDNQDGTRPQLSDTTPGITTESK